MTSEPKPQQKHPRVTAPQLGHRHEIMIDRIAVVAVAVAAMAVAGVVVAGVAAVVVALDAAVTTSTSPVNPSTTRIPPCYAGS